MNTKIWAAWLCCHFEKFFDRWITHTNTRARPGRRVTDRLEITWCFTYTTQIKAAAGTQHTHTMEDCAELPDRGNNYYDLQEADSSLFVFSRLA